MLKLKSILFFTGVLMTNSSERLIYSLLATFSLSLSIFFKKQILSMDKPAIELIIQFMIIAALVLSFNLFLFQRKYIVKIKYFKQNEILAILLASILLLAAYLFTTFGLDYTTSINYSFLSRSSLIFTSMLAFFLLKEQMYFGKIVLIICFFVGIYLITTGGKIITPQIGDMLILVGSFFLSYTSIVQKKLHKNLPPELICWGVITSGAILCIFASFFLNVNVFNFNNLAIIFLVGLTEALIILFMNKAIRVANVTYYTMMNMLVPVINGIMGIMLLNESINLIQIVGGVILLISGILVQKLRA